MTPFEYLAVLISIVLGIGITELLSGVQRLVQHRDRVRFHWLPLAWAGIIFIALVQWWWAAFGLRDRMEWNFFSFLLVLLVPVLLYLAAALVLPSEKGSGQIDLRAHYFDSRPLLFGPLVAASLLEMVRALRVGDAQAAIFDVAAAALLGCLAAVRSPRVHAVATLFAAGLLLVFIVAETLRIA